MEAFLISTGLVTVAEIGDKTMLLAIVLAATWRRPVPIILGILVATLLNHALAAIVGSLAAQWLSGPWMRWIIGLAFLAFAAWALVPDTLGENDTPKTDARTDMSVLWATAIAFFMVEMGDKTQVATAALGAQFENIVPVVLGSTLGMMIANVPAVYIGGAAAARLPLKWIRMAAAAGFAATGLWVLLTG